MNHVIPGGPAKGTPIEEAEGKALSYWITRIGGDLQADPNKKFADRDQALLDAMVAEVDRRSIGDSAPPSERENAAPAQPPEVTRTPLARQATTQLAKREQAGILKTPQEAFKKLEELSTICHLVNAPAAGCAIPDGCGIAWTSTFVDVGRDTYPIAGSAKHGLNKDALNKIAMGMGVSWDPDRSRRLDDGRNPHYCRYLAVGKLRDADGTWIDIFDEKENDLRDGSAQAKLMTEKQLEQQRSNIMSLTISKARNRAIRGRGVACAYEPADLAKPFVSFRLMFTGDSSDPEIRRMKARAMLESENALYGRPVAQGHQLMAAPPVGLTSLDHDPETGEIY